RITRSLTRLVGIDAGDRATVPVHGGIAAEHRPQGVEVLAIGGLVEPVRAKVRAARRDLTVRAAVVPNPERLDAPAPGVELAQLRNHVSDAVDDDIDTSRPQGTPQVPDVSWPFAGRVRDLAAHHVDFDATGACATVSHAA